MRSALLCLVLVASMVPAAAETASTLTWRLGSDAESTTVTPAELSASRAVIQVPTSADGTLGLHCTDQATGETGEVVLDPLAHSEDTFVVSLGPAVAALPYPIDPLAIESKPAAIMTQQARRSVLGMSPAELRRRFADTSAYMLVTAGHHYPLPFGDGLLGCRFWYEGDGDRLVSAPWSLSFGRGLPAGTYPRSHGALLARDRWWIVDPSSVGPLEAPPAAGSSDDIRLLDAAALATAARGPEDVAAMRRWDDGSAVAPWMEVTLERIATIGVSPPRAARALAMVSVAISDALTARRAAAAAHDRSAPCARDPRVVAVDPCPSGSAYPSEHAVVAGAASSVLSGLFPDRAADFERLAAEATASVLRSGIGDELDTRAGIAVGQEVGRRVLVACASDGSDEVWTGTIPEEVGGWRPERPNGPPPGDPLAGTWRPWNLASGDELRPAEPPRPGEPGFERDVAELSAVTRQLTIAQQQIASYWQDKDGTVTPPGHWAALAVRLARQEGLSTHDAALMFATLGTAQADAFIAAWDAKFAYWSVRPFTIMRERTDAGWQPYIATPNFPSYPSGHATTSGAAAAALGAFFPDRATELWECAVQAAESRLLGGIHFRADNDVGLELGRSVAEVAVRRSLGTIGASEGLPSGGPTECLWRPEEH
jgi:membrane-associated phospholipid phosphatase